MDTFDMVVQMLQYVVGVVGILTMPFMLFRVLIPDFKFLVSFTILRFGNPFRKRFRHKFEYHPYYLSERSLKSDKDAKDFAAILHAGYVNSWFDEYYGNLSEERLPLHVFVNWTRTIVEDLMASVNPINHVNSWDSFFRHPEPALNKILRQESIIFEDYELAYLWGGVYYWLKCIVPGFENDSLLRQIETVACHKKYLIPYFRLFKNLANGIEEDYSTVFETASNPASERTITSEQTALLWLAIAKQSEGEIRNKKKLAPLIHQLTGVGEKSLELKITGAFKDEDKKALINIVESHLPHLAEKIRHIEKSNPLP